MTKRRVRRKKIESRDSGRDERIYVERERYEEEEGMRR